MISDEEIDRALDWLVKNADRAAMARANRIYIEESLKPVKATLMKESGQESIGAQEREAYADPRYLELIQGLKQAVEEDERFRWLQKAAEAKIEAYRTMQANQRAQGKAT